MKLIEKNFYQRMWIYLTEMYPIPIRLLNAILLYVSFNALICKIHDLKFLFLSPYTLIGSFSVFAIMLILRMMDELKDKEVDRALFRIRPLPSGRVLESDLGYSLVIMIMLFLAVNLWYSQVLLMALFVLSYALLMFKYFFIPGILRKYLLLNLATHNPIIPIILFYLLVLFSVEHKIALEHLLILESILLIFMYWLLFFAWEISRKIRSKEEENAYITYSHIFGRFGSVLIAGTAQTFVFLIALYIYQTFAFSLLFIAILLLAYIIAVFGFIRFLHRPNPQSSKLSPFAELYILGNFFAVILDLIISLG